MVKVLSGSGMVAVFMAVAAACTPKDATLVEPTVNGGTGGSSGYAGSGGNAGHAGDAGSAGAGGNAGERAASGGTGGVTEAGVPEAGLPRFRATPAGETVRLEAFDEVWMWDCFGSPKVAQLLKEEWVLLRDERRESFNENHAAHYLDGAYQSDCRQTGGCDIYHCARFQNRETFNGLLHPLNVREYVQVGQLPGPSCEQDGGLDWDAGEDPGVRIVPNLESRAPTGPLAVRVDYYLEGSCQSEPITAYITVE